MPPMFFLPTNVTGSTQTGLLMMIDLDVPRNNTRVVLLHWLAPNVALTQGANGTTVAPPANGGGAAPYRQPSPPPGDQPHRYVFMLFAQPASFAIPSNFTEVLQTRVPFDYMGFINQTGLTTPLAANSMTVQNTSVPATTTFPGPSPSAGGNVTGGATPSGGSGVSPGGSSGASGSTGAAGSATSTLSGGASTSSDAAASQFTGAASRQEASSLLFGKIAGAELGILGLFSYLVL
ncbi:PEBP-like protein [Rhizodiscina lignyota]|uniref:PEBP-like protein n=1 Tax=Rhizodiscina lignyota TaxID=1504668 RepID=A0A9P4IRJ4_9PEZI|nr:PEBP-like protein [Rhizodiscina lignyota]